MIKNWIKAGAVGIRVHLDSNSSGKKKKKVTNLRLPITFRDYGAVHHQSAWIRGEQVFSNQLFISYVRISGLRDIIKLYCYIFGIVWELWKFSFWFLIPRPWNWKTAKLIKNFEIPDGSQNTNHTGNVVRNGALTVRPKGIFSCPLFFSKLKIQKFYLTW